MARKNLVFQSLFLVITLGSLCNNAVFCHKSHHIPHMCEAKDDSSDECPDNDYDDRLITKSRNLAAESQAATKFTVKYSLYNGAKFPQTFTSSNFETEIQKLKVHHGAQWKVLIHGFINSDFTRFPANIRDAYLRNMENNSSAKYNVLLVNWEDGACDSISKDLAASQNAAENVNFAGQQLGDLLFSLHKSKILNAATDVHLIGHSLGLHVAGHAARVVNEKLKNVLVWRVSALDPPGPLFWRNSLFLGKLTPYPRLLTPVWIVDAYHTSNMFGEFDRVGDVDFYINGGKRQPSCEIDIIGLNVTTGFNIAKTILQFCSRDYATEIFAKSISDDSMKACSGCNSYEEYEENKCDCEGTPVLGEYVVHQTLTEPPPTLGAAYIKTKRDTSVGKSYLKLLKSNRILFSLWWSGWKPLCL